jgi:hypothetical protein
MYAVTAVFSSLRMRGRSRYTDNQIYVPWPKCTATFRTHCIMLAEGELVFQQLLSDLHRVECCLGSVAYPGILLDGGGVQQIQLRTESRENGDLGAVAP